MSPADWLPLLFELSDRADAIALRWFRSESLPIDRKPDRSLVTKADLEIEQAILDHVANVRPELGVFGEEHGERKGEGDARLIVDPIDATANFARGIPIFGSLLGIEVAGEIVAGMVSAPALKRRWHAARGAGAWEADRRMRVSAVSAIADAQLFHGSLAGGEAVPGTERITALIDASWRQRGFGDFWQHVLVADGCGEIAVDPIVKPWDIAPLQVIVEEAGGRATTTRGERSIYGGTLVTSNGHLHDVALAAFR
jgi:histidinol-phosphatase